MTTPARVPGWDGLVGASLLGTDRQPPPVAALPEPVAAVLAATADQDAEATLLAAAALAVAYQRAGAIAQPPVPIPEPAGEETLPAITPAAVARLEQVLARNDRELFAEWLGAAAASNRRVPYEVLPALLEAQRRHSVDGTGFVQVIGARGAWLAAFRPEWGRLLRYGPAEGLVDPDRWEYGDAVARRAYVAALHELEPPAARELLATALPGEPATERALLVQTIGRALTDADEPLL